MTNVELSLVERLRDMAAEIDEDWAADNQPVEQGGPGGSTPKPVNTPAEAAARIEALEDELDRLEAALVAQQAASGPIE